MELTEALEKRKLERQKARQALDTIFDKTEPQPEIIKSREKQKPVNGYTTGTFSTIRKAFTTGIKAELFLSALNPKKGTYFGLKTGATHTTKQRLELFGVTIGEAQNTGRSFSFPCVNRKERNELAILAATMLTDGWITKLDKMAVSGDL